MATVPDSLKKRGFTHVKSNLKPGQYAGPEIEKAFVFFFEDQIRKAVVKRHQEKLDETNNSED